MEKNIYLLKKKHDEINLYIQKLQAQLTDIESEIAKNFKCEREVITGYYLDNDFLMLNDFLKVDKMPLPDNFNFTGTPNVLNHVKTYVKDLPLQDNVWHRVLEKFLLMVLPAWVIVYLNDPNKEFISVANFNKNNVHVLELTNLLKIYDSLLKSDSPVFIEQSKQFRQYFDYLPHFNYGCWQNNKINELRHAIDFQNQIVKIFADVLKYKHRFAFADCF